MAQEVKEFRVVPLVPGYTKITFYRAAGRNNKHRHHRETVVYRKTFPKSSLVYI